MSYLLLAAENVGSIVDLNHAVAAIVYTCFGLCVFAIAFTIMIFAAPFSVRKEIEEDQNTSLGIIMGSVVIGLAIIIAAAIHGG